MCPAAFVALEAALTMLCSPFPRAAQIDFGGQLPGAIVVRARPRRGACSVLLLGVMREVASLP